MKRRAAASSRAAGRPAEVCGIGLGEPSRARTPAGEVHGKRAAARVSMILVPLHRDRFGAGSVGEAARGDGAPA